MVDTPPAYVHPPCVVPEEFATELAKLGGLLDVGNEVKKLGEAIRTSLNGAELDSNYKRVAYLIFTKAFNTFQAIQTLCRCGFGSDGLSLCGTLFENVVDLLYVQRAPVRRSLRYVQYEQVEKYLQARKILRRKPLPRGRRKFYQRYESTLEPHVRSLLKFFPEKNIKGWSQKLLFQRAKKVKADLPYLEIYWVFCAHKHTLPIVAAGLTISHHSGYQDLPTGPHIKGVYHAAEQSSDLFLKLCNVFQGVFGLSIDARVQKCSAYLQKVSSSLLTSHPEICE